MALDILNIRYIALRMLDIELASWLIALSSLSFPALALSLNTAAISAEGVALYGERTVGIGVRSDAVRNKRSCDGPGLGPPCAVDHNHRHSP